MKQVVLALTLALAAGNSTAYEPELPTVYTLYRSSSASSMQDARLHIATFDAAAGTQYNRENCLIAAQLFQQQPGVIVRYWCEVGRYQRHRDSGTAPQK